RELGAEPVPQGPPALPLRRELPPFGQQLAGPSPEGGQLRGQLAAQSLRGGLQLLQLFQPLPGALRRAQKVGKLLLQRPAPGLQLLLQRAVRVPRPLQLRLLLQGGPLLVPQLLPPGPGLDLLLYLLQLPADRGQLGLGAADVLLKGLTP